MRLNEYRSYHSRIAVANLYNRFKLGIIVLDAGPAFVQLGILVVDFRPF